MTSPSYFNQTTLRTWKKWTPELGQGWLSSGWWARSSSASLFLKRKVRSLRFSVFTWMQVHLFSLITHPWNPFNLLGNLWSPPERWRKQNVWKETTTSKSLRFFLRVTKRNAFIAISHRIHSHSKALLFWKENTDSNAMILVWTCLSRFQNGNGEGILRASSLWTTGGGGLKLQGLESKWTRW